jgi:hypothetical protein
MAADGDDDKPPFLGSWNAVYLLVLGSLAAVIALLSLITAAYR